jgi:hypothetical protein
MFGPGFESLQLHKYKIKPATVAGFLFSGVVSATIYLELYKVVPDYTTFLFWKFYLPLNSNAPVFLALCEFYKNTLCPVILYVRLLNAN